MVSTLCIFVVSIVLLLFPALPFNVGGWNGKTKNSLNSIQWRGGEPRNRKRNGKRKVMRRRTTCFSLHFTCIVGVYTKKGLSLKNFRKFRFVINWMTGRIMHQSYHTYIYILHVVDIPGGPDKLFENISFQGLIFFSSLHTPQLPTYVEAQNALFLLARKWSFATSKISPWVWHQRENVLLTMRLSFPLSQIVPQCLSRRWTLPMDGWCVHTRTNSSTIDH